MLLLLCSPNNPLPANRSCSLSNANTSRASSDLKHPVLLYSVLRRVFYQKISRLSEQNSINTCSGCNCTKLIIKMCTVSSWGWVRKARIIYNFISSIIVSRLTVTMYCTSKVITSLNRKGSYSVNVED